jgi:hypothetical protein
MSGSSFSVVAESLLATGLSVRFRAAGRSMMPAVRDGECVTVAPVAAGDVALGDIVLCETWRGPLAHRVLAIATTASGVRSFALRGDASFDSDRPVEAPAVRGRLVSVERDGRALELVIAGGMLGRRLVVAGLRLRPVLVSAARALVAGRPVVAR